MATPLENVITFFGQLGIFNVVLPFLLVFTIVFAILEKTMILGKEDDKPKRNLDSMVAFVVAMLVVAAGNIVSVINEALPKIFLSLVVLISFMLLAGSFYSTKEFSFEQNKFWKIFLTVLVFIGVILIFLDSIEHEGESWLSIVWDSASSGGTATSIFWGIIGVAGLIAFILFVTYPLPGSGGSST